MNNNAAVKKRNASMDLFRLLSMYMVLVLHCLSQSGALNYLSGINYYVYWWLEALSIIAVDCFVLLSGYFMINTQFKARKIFSIIGTVWLYSVIFSLCSIYISGTVIDKASLFRIFFPITTKKYWFVNSYLALYLFSPFLNKLLRKLNKKSYIYLLIVLLALFSFRVSFLPLTWSQDPSGGMGILLFVTLYSIAGYIRQYPPVKYIG